MWNYSEKVVDHFLHPRNVGEIKKADGIGEVGSLACGDMLKLMFKLDRNGKIADAKFKTFGCASAIASSSALTEMLKGLTLDEAARITNKDIADFLGGLPDEKMHCSVMGREALEAAIANYRGEGDTVKNLEGEIVCKCFGVTDVEIKKVAAENDLTTIDEITNYTKAGGGCGQCKDKIQAILDETNGVEEKTQRIPANLEYDSLTNIQKMHLIEDMIEKRIRPALKQDQGDLELVDITNNTIFVCLKGACKNCPSANQTLRQFIEKEIQKNISPDLKVEEVRK